MSFFATSETSDIASLSSLASWSSLGCGKRWSWGGFGLIGCLSTATCRPTFLLTLGPLGTSNLEPFQLLHASLL
ncbi:hypothetical protein Tco_0562857, partial [Tanacetum coccineum]